MRWFLERIAMAGRRGLWARGWSVDHRKLGVRARRMEEEEGEGEGKEREACGWIHGCLRLLCVWFPLRLLCVWFPLRLCRRWGVGGGIFMV